MQRLKKPLPSDSKNKASKQEQSMQGELFFKNWAPSLFSKHNGLMQSM